MEDDLLPMDHDDYSGEHSAGDIGCALLHRYGNSPREDHQHLCAVVGAMSQELRDQNIPLSPVAYFGAALSSLIRLASSPSGLDPVVPALLAVLSAALSRVSPAVLRMKGRVALDAVEKVLRLEAMSHAGMKAGLSCFPRLIAAGDQGTWSDVAGCYGVVLACVTDTRPEVRKYAGTCLRDVLKNLHGSPLLLPASEGVFNLFERFLLLAGGSSSSTDNTGGSEGALNVLYILAAFKECLSVMPVKIVTSILKRFKTLLELQHPVVTSHIINILLAFCSSPSSEAGAEILLDLLCSLASYASEKEKSPDKITHVARLLLVGVRKVYAINRQSCVPKMPTIFSAYGEILACEHEEAIFAAMEGMKGLIEFCIDELLIKEGLEPLKAGLSKSSGPTTIGKICVIVESLLGYRYSAVWDMSFQIVSAMFDKLGDSSYQLMGETVQSLGELQKLPDEDLVFRKQMHECVGSAVRAMGPGAFLRILPLNLDAENLSDVNVWLLPILRQYIFGAHLSYFTNSILDSVERVKNISKKLQREGKTTSAKSAEGLVYSLWSLLPAFCNYPLDTAANFKDLKDKLCVALRKEPYLHGIICSSLQTLIAQNKEGNIELSASENRIHGQRVLDLYTENVKLSNINAIRASAAEFFSVLSKTFLQPPCDEVFSDELSRKNPFLYNGGCLLAIISEIASIADPKLVSTVFANIMLKLLHVTQNATEQSLIVTDGLTKEASVLLARTKLLDLALSLLPGLGVQEIQSFYVALQPLLKEDEGIVQKKAYKILSKLLEKKEEFCLSKLDDLTSAMEDVLPFCHFSSKRHRLDCLYFLIVHVSKNGSKQDSDILVASFLTEIILALKEANKKTRNRAYELLVKIGRTCEDEGLDGDIRKLHLHDFFNMVAGGLSGETPYMISATVKGLARLAYEFAELVDTAYSLLPSSFLLLQRKNREITKANLGFLKVLVAKSQPQSLLEQLRNIVEGLLVWKDEKKNYFKAKVKLLLQMLVKKCGLDAVKAVMPDEHLKLLTNIRKIKERKERRAATKFVTDAKSLRSKASISRYSRWNHTNIFSDVGDESMYDSEMELPETKTNSRRGSRVASSFPSNGSTLRSTGLRRHAKSLPEDLSDQLEDDPLDLLDRKRTRSALRSINKIKEKTEFDDDIQIDSEGRLVVIEESHNSKKRENSFSDDETETKSETSNYSYTTHKSSMSRQKKRKTSDSGWAYTGKEYTSKKASGDFKKKGKLEPYAYWPLDRKMLSRRPEQKAAARKGMSSVIKLVKKMEGKSAASALSMSGVKFKKTTKSRKKRR